MLPSNPASWLAQALSGLAPTKEELPLWPPILATRGAGSRTALHSHHGMHLLVGLGGELRVRTRATAPWSKAPGVLTRPDVPHSIDAQGIDTLLIFFDPESDAGEALQSVLPEPVRLLSSDECDRLIRDSRPEAIMGAEGVEWTRQVVAMLGGTLAAPRYVHPRVRKLLRILRAMPMDGDRSLSALARAVGLSPSRLMHAFTTSIGIPLRPYLAWLKLQRAAAAITSGMPLAQAAYAAGFVDGGHMSRTFRRMLGTPPSSLRSRAVS